jgi:D-alanyl-D-alanine carboxypeptidase/D-alanyl-D-alanine-endopeptidase (penicillin-binding protein 4)
MKKLFFPLILLVFITELAGQTTAQQLQKAYSLFEKDEQLKHAISSLYVIDAKTGEVVFDKNAQLGLAPASTQKIITSVTAFELLGKDFRQKPDFVIGNIYSPKQIQPLVPGDMKVKGKGTGGFMGSIKNKY